MSTARRVAILLVLVIAAAARISAQPYDPSSFSGMRWRMAGPFRGGRVLAVALVPGQPNHFYFGAVGGGVWETHNAGRTWDPIFDGQPAASIGAIAVAPSDPRVVYVGTGEGDIRGNAGHERPGTKSRIGRDIEPPAAWQRDCLHRQPAPHEGLRD